MSGISAFFSTVETRLQAKYFYLPFCVVCFIAALILGLLITQSGSGLSADSYQYIRTGENLYYGNGFHQNFYYFDQFHLEGGRPYTYGAPLYPLLIAAFMHLGFGSEQAASLVPILCFALLPFPLFFLGKRINGVFTGYIACLICLVLTPLLWLASYAWTDLPYIFFSVLAILFLVKFAESDKAKSKVLCVGGLFTALAILTRYVGVTLALVGLIVIIVKNKSRLKEMIPQVLLFGSISCLPIIPWLIRNMMLTLNPAGTPGGWAERNTGLLNTIVRAMVTFRNDFFADPISQELLSFNIYILAAIVAACFILLAVYVKKQSADRRVLRKYLGNNYVAILYILIYLVILIAIKSKWTSAVATRVVAPTYPFLLLVVISFIFYAYRQIKKPRLKPTLFSIIMILCALTLASQTSSTLAFYQSAKHGQGYNSPALREGQWIAWLKENAPDDAKLYSNNLLLVSFRLRRPAIHSPLSGREKAIDEWFGKLEPDSFSSLFHVDKTDATTAKTYTDFPNDGTKYYWRVRSYNAVGWSVWSDPQSFVNGTVPAPTLHSSASQSTASGKSVTFWQGAVSMVADYAVGVNAGLFPSLLQWGETPRARASSDAAEDSSRTTQGFINGTPPAPTLLSPANGSTVPGELVTFEWKASTGATSYWLVVGPTSNFKPVEARLHSEYVTGTSKEVSGFPNDGTTYYWKVIGRNSAGLGPHSETWSFVNGTPPANPPPPPSLLSPINDEVVASNTVTFQWGAATGASAYQVQVSKEEKIFVICFKEGGSTARLSHSEVAELNQKYEALVLLADFPEASIWGPR